MSQADIKTYWTIQPFKLWGQGDTHPIKLSHMIYYFICFSLVILFHMAQKLPGLKKYKFQQGSIPYQKEISAQSGEIFLDISYCTLWPTLHCDLQFSLIISIPIQALTWWFHFYWLLYIDKENSRRGRVKGDRQQLRTFKHRGKYEIGCYPKSLIIFIAYQLQGW